MNVFNVGYSGVLNIIYIIYSQLNKIITIVNVFKYL